MSCYVNVIFQRPYGAHVRKYISVSVCYLDDLTPYHTVYVAYRFVLFQWLNCTVPLSSNK